MKLQKQYGCRPNLNVFHYINIELGTSHKTIFNEFAVSDATATVITFLNNP